MLTARRVILIAIGLVVLAAVAIGIAAASRERQRSFNATSFEWVVNEGKLPGADCPAAAVNIAGEGTSDLLGEFTIVRRHCFTPPDHPAFEGEVMHDGQYEITAANGDKIWGSYAGELQPTEFGAEGPVRGIITSPTTVDGGTGRYKGASGEHTAVGDYDLVADEGEFTLDGWISY